MYLLPFMTWLAIIKAAYDPSVVALSARDTDSIAFLNAGDGQVSVVETSLVNDAYSIGSPNFGAGDFRATLIAPVLGDLIQTYITDASGKVWKHTYIPGNGWMAGKLTTKRDNLVSLRDSGKAAREACTL
ncbi:hypothetical protein BHYA_0398g00010 [Botrytis hyacinthi]|uniref:Uncharacterized protein n=1 Tax=Botrytis hyacinthi TaxID=278943 RepID=A0A4Z1G4D8_9HELO|nr:hypothetical protein BHYA_0398g00010 [Botrytis hyacinthi]